MARVPQTACGKISLARGIHFYTNFVLISFVRPASLHCEEYVYTYTNLTAQRLYVYELPLLPNNTASETF